MSETKKCKVCGTEYPATEKVCPVCFSEEVESEILPKNWSAIAVVVVVVVLILFRNLPLSDIIYAITSGKNQQYRSEFNQDLQSFDDFFSSAYVGETSINELLGTWKIDDIYIQDEDNGQDSNSMEMIELQTYVAAFPVGSTVDIKETSFDVHGLADVSAKYEKFGHGLTITSNKEFKASYSMDYDGKCIVYFRDGALIVILQKE